MYMADIGVALSYFPVFYKKSHIVVVDFSHGHWQFSRVIVWSRIVFGLSQIVTLVAALSTITVEWGQDIV